MTPQRIIKADSYEEAFPSAPAPPLPSHPPPTAYVHLRRSDARSSDGKWVIWTAGWRQVHRQYVLETYMSADVHPYACWFVSEGQKWSMQWRGDGTCAQTLNGMCTSRDRRGKNPQYSSAKGQRDGNKQRGGLKK